MPVHLCVVRWHVGWGACRSPGLAAAGIVAQLGCSIPRPLHFTFALPATTPATPCACALVSPAFICACVRVCVSACLGARPTAASQAARLRSDPVRADSSHTCSAHPSPGPARAAPRPRSWRGRRFGAPPVAMERWWAGCRPSGAACRTPWVRCCRCGRGGEVRFPQCRSHVGRQRVVGCGERVHPRVNKRVARVLK
jgi:hypothetical protein